MPTKYCVLWYPTVYHEEVGCLYRYNVQKYKKTPKVDIKDGSEKGECWLTIELVETDPVNGVKEHLKIILEVNNRQFTVELTVVDKRKNGLVQYSFSTDIKDSTGVPLSAKDYNKFEKVLCTAAYNQAKQFYHVHEAENERDCELCALITDYQIDLWESDNVAIAWYIEKFGQIFQSYACEISSINKKAKEKEKLYNWAKKAIEWRKNLETFFLKDKSSQEKILQEQEALLTEQEKWLVEKKAEKEEKKYLLETYADVSEDEKKEKIEEIDRTIREYEKFQQKIRGKRIQIKTLSSSKRVEINNEKKSYKQSIEVLDVQLEKLKIDINSISHLCENSLLEYTYCKTLLESRDNKTFILNPEISVDGNHRMIAYNIHSSIRYVEDAKYINQNRFNRLSVYKLDESRQLQEELKKLQETSYTVIQEVKISGEQSTELGEFSFWVSLIVACGAVVVELLSSLFGNPDVWNTELSKTLSGLVGKVLVAIVVLIVAFRYRRRLKNKSL